MDGLPSAKPTGQGPPITTAQCDITAHLVSMEYVDRYERRRCREKRGLKRGEPGVAVMKYEDGRGSCWTCRGKNCEGKVDSDQVTTREETTGEGRTAAGPVWNDNGLVVSGRRLNKKHSKERKTRAQGKEAAGKTAPARAQGEDARGEEDAVG